MARASREVDTGRAGARRARSGRGVTGGELLTARLAPVTLVVGKGGVGKTTVAAALAKHFSLEGTRALVVTTDPAATLLSALGRKIEPTVRPIAIEGSAMS